MSEFILNSPTIANSANSEFNQNSELFQFTPDELEITGKLAQIIQNKISQAGGVISFSHYMELALYYPGLGYYSNNRAKFGAQGDFITAPILSACFGQMLAQQIQELFSFGVTADILEFGAGNGTLAVDILTELGSQIDNYYILELSADLAFLQRAKIAQAAPELLAKVSWLKALPQNFKGVILANEVLDAQPCDLVNFAAGKASGLGVGWQSEQFVFQEYALSGATKVAAEALNLAYDNYRSEVQVISQGFMQSIAAALAQGAVIFIDYGCGESEYYHPQKSQGTLRGFYRQQVLADVLCYPGLIDITASVNFSGIAMTALAAGLELIGYTTQAAFLLNCGLGEHMAKLHDQLSPAEYLRTSNQVNKLLAVNEMGELFKVIGFSKGLVQDSWVGFASNDRSYTL